MWWEILEVSCDADIKKIKRAYAKKIKSVKPEDDQEGFIRLNQAYKQAKQYVKSQKNSPEALFIPPTSKIGSLKIDLDLIEAEDLKNNEVENTSEYTIDNQVDKDLIIKPKEQYSSLYKAIYSLYTALDKRASVDEWNKFYISLTL